MATKKKSAVNQVQETAPEAAVSTAEQQRAELVERAAEAHALPVSRDDNSILPSPVFAIDIEGMDVLASTAINSVSIVYFDASRASAHELASSVATLAQESWSARAGNAEGLVDDDDTLPAVSSCSWILDVDAQLRRYSRTVAPSTQAWWLGASSLAHAAATAPRGGYRASLGDSLHNMRRWIQHRLAEALRGLNLDEAQAVMNSVRFLVRGGQYDAAALETLFQQVLGIRPAVSAVTAFSDTPDPDSSGTLHSIWFYRSVIDIRSYLDGYHSGLLVASGNRELVKEHEDGIYKNASTRARSSSDRLANGLRATGEGSSLNELRNIHTALEVKASGGRHVGEFDVLYDALLILPTLNGNAARQFAESVLGDAAE